MTTNRTPKRRKSQTKLLVIGTVWSVMTPTGVLPDADGVDEGRAWEVFLRHTGESYLYRGAAKVAWHGSNSSAITRVGEI